MKYVMFKGGNFVIFPKSMNHRDFQNIGIPVSAGFCELESYKNQYDETRYKVRVFGKSDSLGLTSNQDDVKTIEISL